MKIHTRISLTGLIVSLALGGLAGAREFSSADGSKTMSGTVTAVSPSSQTATIRKPDGRSITFPISAVAEKDREYLIDWYKAYEMGRKLDIRVNSTEEKGTERKTATARQYSVATQFDLELRNNASFDFEGLEVRYRMFHTKDSDKGKTEDRTTDGVLKVDEIFPRGEVSLGTESVSLEVQKPLPASQCPGGT